MPNFQLGRPLAMQVAARRAKARPTSSSALKPESPFKELPIAKTRDDLRNLATLLRFFKIFPLSDRFPTEWVLLRDAVRPLIKNILTIIRHGELQILHIDSAVQITHFE